MKRDLDETLETGGLGTVRFINARAVTGGWLLLVVFVFLCGCTPGSRRNVHSPPLQSIGIQSKEYYESLAQGCDVFLKMKPVDPNAIYICERTNLAAAILPPVITNLNPQRVIYTRDMVDLEFGDDASITWQHDKMNPNVWKMFVSISGQGEKAVYEEPSTKYCVATFGLYDGSDNLIPTNRILHRVGVEYGWKVRVYSREEKVRIRQIFKLPGPGVWGGDTSLPKGLTLITNCVSPNGEECIKEYELIIKKGSEETEFIQPYGVAPDDPKGEYKISLFLGDQLIKDFSFQMVDGP